MRKINSKNKTKHKFKSNTKKKKVKKYSKNKGFLHKFFLILILFILYLSTFVKRKNNQFYKIWINGAIETINPSKLPLNEHYKILMPKIKYHEYKKINPEEEINLFKLEDSVDYKKVKEAGNGNHIYYSCIIAKAKFENLYIREFVEYYINLGVEKFYFGDDNPEFVENLSDVLDDYIKKGIVDVEFIYHRNIPHHDFCEYTFKAVHSRCKWILIFDVDEYLEFVDKNMTLKSYLEMPEFDKCDVIRIHWMTFDDNNLLYYENKPLKERFTHALPDNVLNIYHKSIVRGKDYGVDMFSKEKTAHQPSPLVTEQCGAIGNIEKPGDGIMRPAQFKYCHLRHHTYKTAEEFAIKMLRGSHPNVKYNYNEIMEYFFKVNEVTEEKLKIIENIVNTTFPQYHKNNN